MKAIITNDQGNVGALKLRLQAEGANDRTLMLLLELQYPMIHRTGLAGASLPDTLEVPVASPAILQLPAGSRLDLCSSPGLEIVGSTTVAVRSDPWEHATMPRARLRIQDPGDWEVVHLILNGRSVPPDGAHDVHPGAIAELKVTLLLDAGERRPLVAYLESPERDESPGYARLRTGIEPLDRVLGGGLVAGGSVMVSGGPKDGRSLLSQMSGSVRAVWASADDPQAHDVDRIIANARKMRADVLVVDSPRRASTTTTPCAGSAGPRWSTTGSPS